MNDPFVEREWKDLCDRVLQTAENLAVNSSEQSNLREQAQRFAEQATPQRYPELLQRVRGAADLAIKWQSERGAVRSVDEWIDEAGEKSFPASDPPSFSRSHA